MSDGRVLANEDCLVLGVVVSRHVQFLLTEERSRLFHVSGEIARLASVQTYPCTCLVLISLPALSVIVAGVLLLDDVFPVDLDHGPVDETNMILIRHGGDGSCWSPRGVRSKDDTRPGRVDLIRWVANGTDTINISR